MPWVMGTPNAHEMRLSVQADFMESSGVYANGDHLLSMQGDLRDHRSPMILDYFNELPTIGKVGGTTGGYKL